MTDLDGRCPLAGATLFIFVFAAACGNGDGPGGELDSSCTTCRDDAALAESPLTRDGRGRDSRGDSAAGDGAAKSDDGLCVDPCPSPKGSVTWNCKKHFMFGTNWAWLNFGGDFGGISSWGKAGVSQASTQYSSAMASMKAAGVSVIRWWMFPRLWSDGITYGSDGAPSGVAGTLVADIQKALELAHQQDVYIMLTPFSFDNFTPTKNEYGIYTRGLKPIIVDATLRQKLLQNLVAPVAKAVAASPHNKRMIAWDLINEPEWAITGKDLYGTATFSPQSGLETVTHAQMETFLKEMAVVVKAHCSSLVTVGGAAIKWPKAWSQVGVDFYQLHYYDWVYEWFPYKTFTPSMYGLTVKPVVMGEFPLQGLSAIPSKGLPAVTADQFAMDLWTWGYSGALSWAYNDPLFPWNPSAFTTFLSQHPCDAKY